MTEGPPSSEASSSKSPPNFVPNQPSASTSFLPQPSVPHSNGTGTPQPYPNYASFNPSWSSGYVGYTPPTSTTPSMTNSNPYAHMLQSPAYTTTQAPQRSYYRATPNRPANAKSSQGQLSSSTPQAPPESLDPKTYKNWDQVVKKFLVKTKMTEALKGFENDMLVLSPEWERTVVAEALKEMVDGLQAVLRQTSASFNKTSVNVDSPVEVDITNTADNSLEERKLQYIQMSNGTVPKTQSSINKSISQFLARTRARNDASNRAEFLKTLAEKKRELGDKASEAGSISSCARVDAKQIDRDKQIKYDIAKYGEGPLLKTTKQQNDSTRPGPLATSNDVGASGAPPPQEDVADVQNPASNESRRKRKLVPDSDDEESEVKVFKPTKKRKGKEKEKGKYEVQQPRRELDEDATSTVTSERHPGLDERISNIETHLALRYVPTPPRTLLARLKFIEDHIVKLEKEYPPWAALHFNQPNRGWPPPPRATPVIVPPHLRSFASASSVLPSTASSSYTPAIASSAPTSSASGSNATASATAPAGPKPRKGNSSLHKAILERLEVQKARSEMGGKGARE